MKVFRRIFGDIDTRDKKESVENVFEKKFDWGYFSQDVDERSDEYDRIAEIALKYGWQDLVIGTIFLKEEILNADVLYFIGAKPFSYPEPGTPDYLASTYSYYCKLCGVYGEQKADFLVNGRARLGSIGLGSLNWVYDELFSTNPRYEDLFANLGLGSRPVKLYKRNSGAENLVQLVLPMLDCDLDMSGIGSECCEKCGNIKYKPTVNGYFTMPRKMDFQIAKTREFFGSGGNASHRIMMSNEVMQKLIQLKMARYHQFVPCGK